MATGRLSAVDIAQLTEQVIYKTDGTDPGNTATVSVNVCNRSSTDNTIFSLAVSDDDTLGDGSQILEHGLVLEPNGVFERTAISKKPEETILKDLTLLSQNKEMSENLFIKDPYILDFLELKDSYSENWAVSHYT